MSSDSESNSEHFCYEEQLRVIKEYNQEALDAFQTAFDIEDKNVTYEEFTDSYLGKFYSSEDFTIYYIENFCELEVPSWVIIDYESTWKYNLCHDYTEQDFHFFRNI